MRYSSPSRHASNLDPRRGTRNLEDNSRHVSLDPIARGFSRAPLQPERKLPPPVVPQRPEPERPLLPKRPHKKRSRTSWPPSPFVEDEAAAIEKEHDTDRVLTPQTSDEEPQERGAVDQHPIILDANESEGPLTPNGRSNRRGGDSSGNESSSSSDGGLPTPPDSSSTTSERRFVLKRQPNGDDEARKREERRQGKSRERVRKVGPDGQQRNRASTLEPGRTRNPRGAGSTTPLNLGREPSPYSMRSTDLSSADTHGQLSSEFLRGNKASPADTKYTNRHLQAAQSGARPVQGRERSFSNTQNPCPERPILPRHVSAMAAYPGGPAPPTSPQRAQHRLRSYDSDSSSGSEESDEAEARRREKRGYRRSMRSNEPQTPPMEEHEKKFARRTEKRSSIPVQRPISPPHQTQSPNSTRVPQAIPPRPGLSAPRVSSLGSSAPTNPSLLSRFEDRPPASLPGSPPDGSVHEEFSFTPHPHRPQESLPDPSPMSFPRQTTLPAKLDHRHEQSFNPNAPGSRNISSVSAAPERTSQPYSTGPSKNTQPVGAQRHAAPQSTTTYPPPHNAHPPTIEIPMHPRHREMSAPFLSPQSPLRVSEIPPHLRRTHSTAEPAGHLPDSIPILRRTSELPPLLSPPQTPTASGHHQPPILPPPRLPVNPKPPGTVTAIPPCPRREFVAGYNDWYFLASQPDFVICPTCLSHVRAHGYGAYFSKVPHVHPQSAVKCDFSGHWIRMAWLITVKEALQHLNMFYALTAISLQERPCPGDSGERDVAWHGVRDLEHGTPVLGFDVCASCARSLDIVFPALKGFVVPNPRNGFLPVLPPPGIGNMPQSPLASLLSPSASGQRSSHHNSHGRDPRDGGAPRRTCDLRVESSRFPTYTDLLDSIANTAMAHRQPPNLAPFISQARRFTTRPECPQDRSVSGRKWHISPLVPEWTVCEDCYEEVVKPLAEEGSVVAGEVGRWPEWVDEGASRSERGRECVLWERGRREEFRSVCEGGEWKRR